MSAKLLLFVVYFIVSAASALGQTSAFTYQGKLTDAGNPANGVYDMQFNLFDAPTAGSRQGPTITNASITVTTGIFSVQLDFGAGAFSGPPRYLEIGVRPAGSPDSYNVLLPRQLVTSTPYSVRSLNSSVADVLSSACVGCVTSTQVGSVSGSVVTGTIPVASVPAGSGAYVQNTSSPQAASNFNITGDGTAGGTLSANAINAAMQYNMMGGRVLSAAGTANLFAGFNSGTNNTGSNNSFFGPAAGAQNTTGGNNSYFGTQAGADNQTGVNNAFFGYRAGFQNTSGYNSFFGNRAGESNTTATDNAFFGNLAGTTNTTGNINSFFGSLSGLSNTTGIGNSFFGAYAGLSNTTGSANSFFGEQAGYNNTAAENSFFGAEAGEFNVGGAGNSFFGSLAGRNNTSGSNNSFFGIHAGLEGFSSFGSSLFGAEAGLNNTGGDNTFFGYQAGLANTSGAFNVFAGTFAGNSNTTGHNNTIIGHNADVSLDNLSFATAIGSGAVASLSNSIYLGRASGADAVRIPGSVVIDGTLVVNSLDAAGSMSICLNASNRFAPCSSSLRYKTSVQTFLGGLDILRRLRPITFDWTDGGMHDIGFGAEEVEKVEPLLTTRNAKGEIEGVKYGQVTTVLVNAVKEQQAQIAEQQRTIEQQQKLNQAQQKQLRRLQTQLGSLQRLVCVSHRRAGACK